MKRVIEQNVKSGKLTDEVASQMMEQLGLSPPPVKFKWKKAQNYDDPLHPLSLFIRLQKNDKIYPQQGNMKYITQCYDTNEWQKFSFL